MTMKQLVPTAVVRYLTQWGEESHSTWAHASQSTGFYSKLPSLRLEE